MPHYQIISQLPEKLMPIQKMVRVCDACLGRRYLNSPPPVFRTEHKCKHCERRKSCGSYEKWRLAPVPVVSRERIVPVVVEPELTVMQHFNIRRIRNKRKNARGIFI